MGKAVCQEKALNRAQTLAKSLCIKYVAIFRGADRLAVLQVATNETKPETTMKKNQLIEVRNVTPRATKWQKLNNVTPANSQGQYHADILPGHSIRIFGTMTNHIAGPQEFDKVFKIGDAAEYGSFNLIYVGKIVAIGAKTITIKHYENSAEVTKLQIFGFADKNWNFDLAKIQKHNAEESQCI